jgi:NhaA family Na+:H+ antiporter
MGIRKLVDFALLFHKAVDKGFLLFGSAILGLIIANSHFSHLYHHFLEQTLSIPFGPNGFSLSIHHWINDLLMSIFFLIVGMEIKREMSDGHLVTKEQRILPIVAASFGVAFPVLIYIAFNFQDDIAMKAWAAPATTDIAFALGVFAIFGRKLPATLRVFLTALAIIDDLIAVIIIALFYSGPLQLFYFLPIALCYMLLYLLAKYKVASLISYLLIGIFMWYFFFQSGIHPTISGVLLGMFIPMKDSSNKSPLKNLERILTPYSAYLILPLFAFSNSGIDFSNVTFGSLLHPVVLGIIFGLLIGKTFGISLSVHLLQKLRIVSLPNNIKMKHFYYVSILCGIGFTMSLFIALIAFELHSEYLEFAKIGIIFGSILAAIITPIAMKVFKL